MKYGRMPLELMPVVVPCAPKLKIGSAVEDKTLKNKGRTRKMMTSFTRLLISKLKEFLHQGIYLMQEKYYFLQKISLACKIFLINAITCPQISGQKVYHSTLIVLLGSTKAILHPMQK